MSSVIAADGVMIHLEIEESFVTEPAKIQLAARGFHLAPEVLEKLSRPTLPVAEAGRLLFNIGRGASYAAAGRGEIPTVKIGRKLFVPTWKLREMLNLDQPLDLHEPQKAA